MNVFEDPKQLGRRVSAVRGWMQMQRPEFANLVGVSESTVRRWEDGEIGKKRANPEARQQFAEELVRRTGCPPELLSLLPPEDLHLPLEAVQELEKHQDELQGRVGEVEDLLGQALEEGLLPMPESDEVRAVHERLRSRREQAELESTLAARSRQSQPNDSQHEESTRGSQKS